MKIEPKNIDEYLKSLDKEKRTALQKLRKDIKAAAPGAEECISYKMPAFRFDGRILVYFAAMKKHCSFFPTSYPIKIHQTELKDYSTSKGTIRFPIDSPLPAALVRKLVKTRIAQIESR